MLAYPGSRSGELLAPCIKARFHYESGKDYSLFVLSIFLLCLALALILNAERSIKETKNALVHARSGNEPLALQSLSRKSGG